jgi:hypothetical protein
MKTKTFPAARPAAPTIRTRAGRHDVTARRTRVRDVDDTRQITDVIVNSGGSMTRTRFRIR